MTARIFWFLPTAGDGRSIVGASHASANIVEPAGFRRPSLRYLTEVAQAADRLGYEGVLTPTGTWCEDAWLTTAALLQSTRRLKFLVAFRPGLTPSRPHLSHMHALLPVLLDAFGNREAR